MGRLTAGMVFAGGLLVAVAGIVERLAAQDGANAATGKAASVTIDYPAQGSVFPPSFLLWLSSGARRTNTSKSGGSMCRSPMVRAVSICDRRARG